MLLRPARKCKGFCWKRQSLPCLRRRRIFSQFVPNCERFCVQKTAFLHTVRGLFLFAKFRFSGLIVFAQTKAFPLRGRCPEGADEVEKFRFRPRLHINAIFYRTPHQSATLTASPQGEAFVAAISPTNRNLFNISVFDAHDLTDLG